MPPQLEYASPRPRRESGWKWLQRVSTISGLCFFAAALGAVAFTIWLDRRYDGGPYYGLVFIAAVMFGAAMLSTVVSIIATAVCLRESASADRD